MLSIGIGLNGRSVVGAFNPAVALLGNEPAGIAYDAVSQQLYIKDPTTPSNNYLGDANGKLAYASPSAKWIVERDGILRSGSALRCEYDPLTRQPLGVRIESQRTNLYTRSVPEGFTLGEIGAGGVLPTVWSIPASLGLKTELIAASDNIEDGIPGVIVRISGVPNASGAYRLQNSGGFTAVIGTFYAHSFYCRMVAGSKTNISGISSVPVNYSVLAPEAKIDATRLGASRVEITGGAGASSAGTIRSEQRLSVISGQEIDITLMFGGVQCEVVSSFTAAASSFIPTTTAQVTRAVDSISIATSLFPFSLTEMSVLIEYDLTTVLWPARARLLNLNAGNNRFEIRASDDGTVAAPMATYGTGVGAGDLGPGPAVVKGAATKIAVGIGAIGGVFFQNGAAPSNRPTNAAAAGLAAGTLHIGSTAGTASHIEGHVKRLKIIPRRLTDLELQALSA